MSFKETEFFVTISATDMSVNNTDNLSPSNTVIISRKLWIITLFVILVTQLIFYIDIYNFIQLIMRFSHSHSTSVNKPSVENRVLQNRIIKFTII